MCGGMCVLANRFLFGCSPEVFRNVYTLVHTYYVCQCTKVFSVVSTFKCIYVVYLISDGDCRPGRRHGAGREDACWFQWQKLVLPCVGRYWFRWVNERLKHDVWRTGMPTCRLHGVDIGKVCDRCAVAVETGFGMDDARTGPTFGGVCAVIKPHPCGWYWKVSSILWLYLKYGMFLTAVRYFIDLVLCSLRYVGDSVIQEPLYARTHTTSCCRWA